jgi:excisionase family DNA binding protein
MSKTTSLPLLSIAQVAERLGISDKTVRRWIKSGDLIAHRLGAQWRISEADLSLFLQTHRGVNLAHGEVQ